MFVYVLLSSCSKLLIFLTARFLLFHRCCASSVHDDFLVFCTEFSPNKELSCNVSSREFILSRGLPLDHFSMTFKQVF